MTEISSDIVVEEKHSQVDLETIRITISENEQNEFAAPLDRPQTPGVNSDQGLDAVSSVSRNETSSEFVFVLPAAGTPAAEALAGNINNNHSIL